MAARAPQATNMILNYILIPENVTRCPRLGHRHKASSLISRAGRRPQGEAKGKTTAPAKTKAYWDNIASRIGAFIKRVKEYVAPHAAGSTGPKDLFNTESLMRRRLSFPCVQTPSTFLPLPANAYSLDLCQRGDLLYAVHQNGQKFDNGLT
ncbi:hypothetical protein JOM56_002976 [Amanita muscaria]